jgi:hypothetical protein
MSQQDQWQPHPSNASMPGRCHYPSMVADDSSTFVKPLHAGSSQYTAPYPYAVGTAIPPPPPNLYRPLPSQSKRNRVHVIAITILTVLVVGLGSLEGVQLTTHTLFPTFLYWPAGSIQAVITPNQHATAPLKTTPMRILTPGTIKENVTLTCSGCNNPVLTTITSITIDTTHLRTIWTATLNNQSGAEQIDYFREFGLQDPMGNTYEGTGNLNSDFFLRAGHMVFKTEIFSFLPRPDASYTLITRFGISGITYDPLQLSF